MKKYELSIVVPLCKPKSAWRLQLRNNIEGVKKCFPNKNLQFIIVNDGYENSNLLNGFAIFQETTPDVIFLSHAVNKGKGHTLRHGVKAARGKYVIVTDFDFPYVHHNLVDMYLALEQGYDVVTGRRDKQYFKKLPFKRYLISKACNLFNKAILRLSVGDTQSGLKAFNQLGRTIFLSTTINRFLFDTEFIQLSQRCELQIKSLPITLRDNITFSNMSTGILLAECKNFIYLLLNRNKNIQLQNTAVNTKIIYTKDKRKPESADSDF